MMIFYLISLFFYATAPLNAVLDGRVAPIYLTTRYTFTNYELARGSVYFLNGFDVPLNGTIILDISQGMVYGKSTINNGTLFLKSDLEFHHDAYISGSCFLQPNNYTLYYGRPWPTVFDECPYLKLLNPGSFFSRRKRGVIHTARTTIDLRAVTGNVGFSGGTVYFTSNKFLTPTTALTLIFDDITLIYAAKNALFTFNNDTVQLESDVIVKTNGTFSFKNLYVNGFNVSISAGSRIKINNINIPFDATLAIDNAGLDFVSSTLSPITIGNLTAFQGQMIFSGQCSLKSSTGNQLLVNPDLDIIFTSGSQLSLVSGCKLTIQ